MESWGDWTRNPHPHSPSLEPVKKPLFMRNPQEAMIKRGKTETRDRFTDAKGKKQLRNKEVPQENKE